MEKLSFDSFDELDLSLWYCGRFEDNLTENLIDLSESDNTESGLGKSKKKISFLMAESFQNIIRHGATEDKEDEVTGSFGITNKNGVFHIFSSNFVPTTVVDSLKMKLDEVNGLNQDELKAKYRNLLDKGVLSDKGGAGLGLIEMARKTGRKLQYSFVPNSDLTEFNLQLAKSLDDNDGVSTDIQDSVAFVENLKSNGVLLAFKGDFDSDTSDNMARMIMENTLKDKELGNTGKRFFHVAIELLQNISRHGQQLNDKTDGVLIVSKLENQLCIQTRNYIEFDQSEKIKEILKGIENLNPEEITKLYKTKLKESIKNENSNAGVGLIDVVRSTNGNLDFSISEKKGRLQLTFTASIRA